MSCMEHLCVSCDNLVCDNAAEPDSCCPNCGGTEFVSTFDEAEDDARYSGGGYTPDTKDLR
jgi:predicted  nucleic acid-binding Zn-ribbon protein